MAYADNKGYHFQDSVPTRELRSGQWVRTGLRFLVIEFSKFLRQKTASLKANDS